MRARPPALVSARLADAHVRSDVGREEAVRQPRLLLGLGCAFPPRALPASPPARSYRRACAAGSQRTTSAASPRCSSRPSSSSRAPAAGPRTSSSSARRTSSCGQAHGPRCTPARRTGLADKCALALPLQAPSTSAPTRCPSCRSSAAARPSSEGRVLRCRCVTDRQLRAARCTTPCNTAAITSGHFGHAV